MARMTRYRAPNPGDVVTVVSRFRNPGYGVPGGVRGDEEFTEVKSENVQVLPPYPWMTSREFCVPTGQGRDFPISVVSLESVVYLSRAKRNRISGTEQVKIKSSDGKSFYKVTLENGHGVRCTCRGFAYRGRCRHLKEAEK